MEQAKPVLKEPTIGVPNRKLENILRATFSPSRESVCRLCSLRPAFCSGSVAEWHRCRYALRIRGDQVLFPSDLPVVMEKKEVRAKSKGMEELIVKTMHRLRLLTSVGEQTTS
nr:hypothetical protein [Candidatus Njordarchaeota archaeon]